MLQLPNEIVMGGNSNIETMEEAVILLDAVSRDSCEQYKDEFEACENVKGRLRAYVRIIAPVICICITLVC